MKVTLCNGNEVTCWKTSTEGLVAVSINAIDGGPSSPFGWQITHVTSGMSVIDGLSSRDQAKELAARLGLLDVDWTQTRDELRPHAAAVIDVALHYYKTVVWPPFVREKETE